MARPVKWLLQVLKNLEQAYDYIAENDPDADVGVVLKIQAATEQLAGFPLMGRVGRVEGTRELVIGGTPFIVLYRVKGQTIAILRVLHASRKYPN